MSTSHASAARWRYRLRADIHPTDARVLVDALDGEPFGLNAHLGAEAVRQMIDAFVIEVDEESDERWDDFANDLSILSVYLTQQQIVGHEIEIGAELRGWKILARRGETVRVAIDVWRDPDDGTLVLGEEDEEALAAQWPSLPEWARASLHPPRKPGG
jgi:hypothetical protein